jgi:hypothetical protein
MTCRELRLYFEDPLRLDLAFAEEADHLARCEECARFVEMQGRLGSGLRLAREMAPRFPTSLDAKVLAGYRQHVADRAEQSHPEPRRRAFVVLRRGAAAAVAAATLFLLLPHAYRSFISQVRKGPAVAVDSGTVAASVPVSPVASPLSTASRYSAANRATHIPRSHQARVSNLEPAVPSQPSAGTLQSSRPATFRSLMYCDELSCGEGLDIIRVQLPASVTAFAPGPDSSGPVFADVLVGDDGIARGIRIVR